jgi:hypothetical protein
MDPVSAMLFAVISIALALHCQNSNSVQSLLGAFYN